MLPHLAAVAAHPGWYGPGPWPFFFVIPLFWIALIVVLAVVFGRRRRHLWAMGSGPWGAAWASRGSRSAEATLAERFAQGDIDEQEYRARLEVLRANRDTPPLR